MKNNNEGIRKRVWEEELRLIIVSEGLVLKKVLLIYHPWCILSLYPMRGQPDDLFASVGYVAIEWVGILSTSLPQNRQPP